MARKDGHGAVSAGLLLYRQRAGATEVLLGHPGGPYFASKNEGAWGIPKGLVTPGEDPLAGACREFHEETGFVSQPPYIPLPSVRLRSGKLVHAWAFVGDCDPTLLKSNLFSMEWPPRSGRTQEFPEVDRGAFFTLPRAREMISLAQLPLLDALAKLVSGNGST